MRSLLLSAVILASITNSFAQNLSNKQKAGVAAAAAVGSAYSLNKLQIAHKKLGIQHRNSTLFHSPAGTKLASKEMDEILLKGKDGKRFKINYDESFTERVVEREKKLHPLFKNSNRILSNDELKAIATKIQPGQVIKVHYVVEPAGFASQIHAITLNGSNPNEAFAQLKTLQNKLNYHTVMSSEEEFSSKGFIKQVSVVETINHQRVLTKTVSKTALVKGRKNLKNSLLNIQAKGKITKVSVKHRISKGLIKNSVGGLIGVASLATMGSSIYSIIKGFSGESEHSKSRFNGGRSSGKDVGRSTAAAKSVRSAKTAHQ